MQLRMRLAVKAQCALQATACLLAGQVQRDAVNGQVLWQQRGQKLLRVEALQSAGLVCRGLQGRMLEDLELLQVQRFEMPSQFPAARPCQAQFSSVQAHCQARTVQVDPQIRYEQLIEIEFDASELKLLDAELLAQMLPVQPAEEGGYQQ